MDTDSFKVLMTTSSYTPDFDAHNFRNDVEANEVSGTGYSAGGTALVSPTVTLDTSNNLIKFDATDTSWSSSSISNARYAIVYKSRGGASSADEVLLLLDFGSNFTSTNGTFTIQYHANGLGTFSY